MTRREVAGLRGASLIIGVAALISCGEGSTGPGEDWLQLVGATVTIEYHEPDESLAPDFLQYATQTRNEIEQFFGESFGESFGVRIYPDRSSLTAYWRAAWGQPSLQPECWLIASANATLAVFLSPRLWSTDACSYAPSAVNVRRVVGHELVHVLHNRMLGPGGFSQVGAIGWFVEGAAVYASGQLDAPTRASVRALVSGGHRPASLESVLTGPQSYAVAGSISHYLDATYGREVLTDLLRERTTGALLGVVGVTEGALIDAWSQFVLTY